MRDVGIFFKACLIVLGSKCRVSVAPFLRLYTSRFLSLSFSGHVDEIDPDSKPLDGLPYTTLVYGNGPGPGREQNLTGVDTSKYRGRETT